MGTRLGLVYKTSLSLGLETTRFVHSAGVGIVYGYSLIPRPQNMSLVPSLVPRPDKQSGNDLTVHVLHGM